MATLNVQHTILAFDDKSQAGNPLLRFIDWTRRMLGIVVDNPRQDKYTIAAGGSTLIFDGTRTSAIDGTTQFSLTKNPILKSTYRFTFTAGTNPALRTDRALNLNTLVVTFTPNGDGTLTFSVAGGVNPLAAVQIGDSVFVPGVSTGDTAGPFSPSNEGAWTVLVNGNSTAVLGRTGAFSGFGETKTVTAASQFVAYSATGILVGDKVDISAGFAAAVQGSYSITQVTPTWFEVTSAKGLPAQAGVIPTAASMQFYTSLKRWLRIEVDQEATVRYNGDTGSTNRISPLVPGDSDQRGWMEKFGPVFSLTLVNRASIPLKAVVQSAE